MKGRKPRRPCGPRLSERSGRRRLSERSACGTRVERTSKKKAQATGSHAHVSDVGVRGSMGLQVQFSTVQYRKVQHNTLQYSTVHYSTGHYSTKQHSSANRSHLAQDVDDRARPEHAQIEKCSNGGHIGHR